MGMYYEFRPLQWEHLNNQPVDLDEIHKELAIKRLLAETTTESNREKEAR